VKLKTKKGPIQGVYKNHKGNLFTVRLFHDRFVVLELPGGKEYFSGSVFVDATSNDPAHMIIKNPRAEG